MIVPISGSAELVVLIVSSLNNGLVFAFFCLYPIVLDWMLRAWCTVQRDWNNDYLHLETGMTILLSSVEEVSQCRQDLNVVWVSLLSVTCSTPQVSHSSTGRLPLSCPSCERWGAETRSQFSCFPLSCQPFLPTSSREGSFSMSLTFPSSRKFLSLGGNLRLRQVEFSVVWVQCQY